MAACDLTTIDRVKTYLGIKDTNSDVSLAWLVTAASKWIASQMFRNILQQSYLLVEHGTNQGSLYLPNGPVSEVTSVYVDDVLIPRAPGTGQDGWVLLRDRLYLNNYAFTCGTANIRVTYVGGFAACPEDVEQSVIMWCAELFRKAPHTGIATRTHPQGESVTFSPDDIPVYIEETISSLKTILGVAQ